MKLKIFTYNPNVSFWDQSFPLSWLYTQIWLSLALLSCDEQLITCRWWSVLPYSWWIFIFLFTLLLLFQLFDWIYPWIIFYFFTILYNLFWLIDIFFSTYVIYYTQIHRRMKRQEFSFWTIFFEHRFWLDFCVFLQIYYQILIMGCQTPKCIHFFAINFTIKWCKMVIFADTLDVKALARMSILIFLAILFCAHGEKVTVTGGRSVK